MCLSLVACYRLEIQMTSIVPALFASHLQQHMQGELASNSPIDLSMVDWWVWTSLIVLLILLVIFKRFK